jgi:hypothetical protein
MRLFVFFILLLFWHFSVLAQPEQLPETNLHEKTGAIIKTNPIAILWGPIPYTAEFRLVYENLVVPRQSLLIGASFLGKSMVLTMQEMADTTLQYQAKTKVSGFRIQLEYRYYFKSKYDENWGYYIAPHFSFSKASFTDGYNGLIGYAWEFRYLDYGLIVGNQTVLSRRALDIWCGLGYKKHLAYWIEPTKTKPTDDFYDFMPDIKIYFGFNFGIAY